MSESPLILYIEDNYDNLKLVKRILHAFGFNFHGASNNQEALAFLSQQTPDLILMDINLPGVDGYTLTQQLRQRQNLASIPIIALTANVMKADREKASVAGCDGFIQKPINVDRLPDQILEYLNRN
ncbi:MAG: response regulator [Ardenticatenaceae bacterium]|nr:response regulator [Anaerolineales bacterium]MCB8923509.1 response regulator [Ardenticatenaceae bacterium]MCB9003766.1 response regulator [Ardenticatenaceae bacterium]